MKNVLYKIRWYFKNLATGIMYGFAGIEVVRNYMNGKYDD